MKAREVERGAVQKRLEDELERIQEKLGLGLDLRVMWTPNAHSRLSGEVKGNVILIYEDDADKAFETLRHEVLDYFISQAIKPYRDVTNRLITMVNEEAYKRKERVVEALTRLLL